MSKKVFHYLDEVTFKGVDNLKAQPQFSQASTAIEGLPDEYQKWINQGLTYILSFFPIIIFLVVLILASMKHGEVAKREKLIDLVSRYNSANAQITTLGSNLVGKTVLTDEGTLNKLLGSFENSYSLKSNSLKTIEFNGRTFGKLIEAQATIVFKDLSNPKLVALLEMLAVKEKAKISNISIKKGKETLKGEISFIHYSRNN